MLNRRVCLFALMLVLILFVVVRPSPALACSTTFVPTATKPDLPENRAEITPIIFEGVVTGYDLIEYRATASVMVYQYLKGIGPGTVYIDDFGNNGADCRQTLKVGQHAIFYANGDPYSRLSANYFRAYKATDEASPENIQKIIERVRQKPIILDNMATVLTTATPTIVAATSTVVVTPQPSPTVTQRVTPTQNNSSELNGLVWFGLGIVLGGGVIAGLFLTVGRRKHA